MRIVTVSTGESDSLSGWSRKTGIPRQTIWKRLAAGKSPDQAIGMSPSDETRSWGITIEAAGTERTIVEWSRVTGIPVATIYHRLSAGWTASQVVGVDSPPGLHEWNGKYYTLTELSDMHGKKVQT